MEINQQNIWPQQLEGPVFYLWEDVCRKNIDRMFNKAKQFGLGLRPHFKTHQSGQVGEWFKKAGYKAITVSSWRMARYFADFGWQDILVALPYHKGMAPALASFKEIAQLSVMVDGPQSLNDLLATLNRPVKIYLELDVGYHRTGLTHQLTDQIQQVLALSRENSFIVGVSAYVHGGDSYTARGSQAVLAKHRKNLLAIATFKKAFPDVPLCYGDTPTCSLAQNFEGIDEISPGNFVFYDLTQGAIGSCQQSDIACFMAVPIMAVYPQRKEIVVHGGSVHFSLDSLDHPDYGRIFGLPFLWKDGKSHLMDGGYLKKLSQEHGTISFLGNMPNGISVGDVIGVFPVHSCLAAANQSEYRFLGSDFTVGKLF